MVASTKVVVNAKSLKQLTPVLDSWVETVLEYSKVTEDACWWYNERANISILAAAAWRTTGWVALEEYSTNKRGGDGDDTYGRCDLYMENGKISYAIEAKHAWQPIGGSGISYAEKKINLAWKDVGSLQNDEADIRIAATFIIPSIAKSQLSNEEAIDDKHIDVLMDKWLKTFQNELEKKYSVDALAYVYNPSERHINAQGRLFPGIVLLLQYRQRASNTSAK